MGDPAPSAAKRPPRAPLAPLRVTRGHADTAGTPPRDHVRSPRPRRRCETGGDPDVRAGGGGRRSRGCPVWQPDPPSECWRDWAGYKAQAVELWVWSDGSRAQASAKSACPAGYHSLSWTWGGAYRCCHGQKVEVVPSVRRTAAECDVLLAMSVAAGNSTWPRALRVLSNQPGNDGSRARYPRHTPCGRVRIG